MLFRQNHHDPTFIEQSVVKLLCLVKILLEWNLHVDLERETLDLT